MGWFGSLLFAIVIIGLGLYNMDMMNRMSLDIKYIKASMDKKPSHITIAEKEK